MKKVLSLIIVMSLLLSLALPALGTQAASANDGKFPKVLIDFSNQSTINKSGLKASTEFTKSGAFSALLSAEALKKTSVIPVELSDISGAEYLELYVYTPGATSTAFALTLVSDNPETPVVDCYYALVACNFKGLKNCSYKIASLRKTGTPAGLDKIEKAMIVPGYGGSKVDENARIYLDNVRLCDVASEDANKEEEPPKIKPAIIYDSETGLPSDKSGGYMDTFEGKKVFHWGPGDEDLRKGLGKLMLPSSEVIKKYQDLVIEVYSVKNTGNSFLFRLYGSSRFYKASWLADWEGEWREIRIPISGGASGYGEFVKADSSTEKVDFEIYEATYMTLTTPTSSRSPYSPDTEIYIRKIYLDGVAQTKTVANPLGEIIYPDEYDPESMTDYVSMVKEKHPNKHHPRLVVTDELLARIKKYKDTDPYMKKVYNHVVNMANVYLDTPPEPAVYRNSSGTADRFTRTVENVSRYCGLMYLMTGDTKYADRVWAEVEEMINCKANYDLYWYETSTGLDSAHIADGIALAYDWCYDYWAPEQKLAMRNAIMENAFAYAIKIRRGAGYMAFRNNVVGANSKGYMSAFLAICDEEGYENLANEFINNVITYMPIYFYHQFAPNGNYAEGSGYWAYTINNLSYLFTIMNTAIGTDGGLSDDPGFAQTGLWVFSMRGPKGDFNHSDADVTSLQTGDAAFHYLAQRYNYPSLSAFRIETCDKYGDLSVEDLFWYNPEAKSQLDWRDNLPTDYFYDGLEPVVSLRSTFESDTNWIAGKGGNRNTGHDQSDAGSYIIDALGVRWIEDTGRGVYAVDTDQIRYYRMRAEAHNCLYFNPETGGGEGGGQTIAKNMYDTLCPMVDSGVTDGAAFGVLDLRPSYQEDTKEYRRGIGLINKRTQFIIRDEFKGVKSSELYSYFHTTKDNAITINPDGKSLTMKNKYGMLCKVNFITDIPKFELGVMEAVSHPASPVPGPDNVQDKPTTTFHKFYLHAYDVKDASITVVFTPMPNDEDVVLPEIYALSDWDKYLESSVNLTSVSVDGIPLTEFRYGVGAMNVETDKVGVVTATSSDDIELSITQATKMGESATIKATSKKTGESFNYKVNFVEQTIPGSRTGVEYSSVIAPRIPEPQNGPESLNDGDLSTRFAIDGYDGEATFTVDLGSIKNVTGISIAFYNGILRKNKFKIETSEDNVNFTEVLPITFSPGNTDQLVSYEIVPSTAQYVRFTGYGAYAGDETTQASKWNSVTQFVVQEALPDFDDTKEHWAQPNILLARQHGLVNGMGDGKYMPENSVTRAEFLTMMVRACGFSGNEYEEGTFKDVKKDDWYSATIMAALERGIIPSEMTADGKIYPNQKLTREEMCAIAALSYSQAVRREVAMPGATSRFTDLSDGPYLSYIDKAIGLRLANGMSENTFAPKNTITRAQAATILARLYIKIFNVNN